MNTSDIAQQYVIGQAQSLRASLSTVAVKQAVQQEQAVVNLLTQNSAPAPSGNGQRGSVIDIIV